MLRRLPVGVALALSLPLAVSSQPLKTLKLELRVFDGPEEVTSQTRVTIHRAGDRGQALVQTPPGSARIELTVPEGIYDAQAIRERGGEVLNIRWANRLIVMPYPDEGGHHLEVVNFKSGYGALQVRSGSDALPEVALYAAGSRDKEVAVPITTSGYVLFVVPAGRYDLLIKGSKGAWHSGLEVPLDRTRLWMVPQGSAEVPETAEPFSTGR